MIADLTVAFLTYQHRNAVCAAVVVIGVGGTALSAWFTIRDRRRPQ